MVEADRLRAAVLERLGEVIDPETGTDVLQMNLVQDLQVDAQGVVSYVFVPSSPFCPAATAIAMDILDAIGEVAGVSRQEPHVSGYYKGKELAELLRMRLA